MNPELKNFEDAVAALTAPGQPFELNEVEINGVSHRNYASMACSIVPQNYLPS